MARHSVEQPGFLGEAFFKQQARISPDLTHRAIGYKMGVDMLTEIVDIKVHELNDAQDGIPQAEQELDQKKQELATHQATLNPNPELDHGHGGWRRSLRRTRTNLHTALAHNTVPWPVVGIARRLAQPEDPSVAPFKQEVAQAHARMLRERANAVQRAQGITLHHDNITIPAWRKLITTAENKLLDQYEGDLTGESIDTVVEYLSTLSADTRVKRLEPAVRTYVATNAPRLLEEKQLGDFQGFIQEHIHRNDPRATRMRDRLLSFVHQMQWTLREGPITAEQYKRFEEYSTHRWEAYLRYSIHRTVARKGLINNFPDVPRTFQT